MAEKSPTRMGKKELAAELEAAGYSKDTLTGEDGKLHNRPMLIEMLQAHRAGEIANAVQFPEEGDEADDIGIAVLTEAVGDENEDTAEDDIGEPVGKTASVEVVVPCDNEPEIDVSEEEEPDDVEPPSSSDPEWTQYVLGQFTEDELDGQNPRVEGLRRVAGELVGTIIEEGCDLVSPPTEANQFRACAKAWVVFLTRDGYQKRFEALADAHGDNCLEDFSTYLVAMADTRAKGRAFRSALCLRRVVAAEELSKTASASADVQIGGSIHTGQISIIRLLSDRHKIDVSKVLDELEIAYDINDSTGEANIRQLTYDDALRVTKRMREMKE